MGNAYLFITNPAHADRHMSVNAQNIYDDGLMKAESHWTRYVQILPGN